MSSIDDEHSHVESHESRSAPQSPLSSPHSAASSDVELHAAPARGCRHQRELVAGSPYRRCKKCDAESSQRWRRSHPWKTIWLAFVRRAYRKFGKENVARYDLRWKGLGVRALADAITRQAGPSGKVCTPQALAWADAEASLLLETRARSRSAAAAASVFHTGAEAPISEEDAQEDVEEAQAHAVAAVIVPEADDSDAPLEDADDSGPVVTAAASPFSSASAGGVPELEGKQWVLTWPANMSTLDLQRLVLIDRADALHRTRNAGQKRKRKGQAGEVIADDVVLPSTATE
jgi:hypothetical protein